MKNSLFKALPFIVATVGFTACKHEEKLNSNVDIKTINAVTKAVDLLSSKRDSLVTACTKNNHDMSGDERKSDEEHFNSAYLAVKEQIQDQVLKQNGVKVFLGDQVIITGESTQTRELSARAVIKDKNGIRTVVKAGSTGHGNSLETFPLGQGSKSHYNFQ